MEKVVNGKLYNTETAELVSEWDNGCNGGDFHRYSEELYRTKKGNWFIYKDGGPMSCMSVPSGSNNWTGSEDIEPLQPEEAFEVMERHNNTKAIAKHFPNRVEEA